jgi:hypothetical protein
MLFYLPFTLLPVDIKSGDEELIKRGFIGVTYKT